MNEEDIRQVIRDELRNFITSDQYLFGRNVKFDEGIDIEFGTITGTKHGTSTSQKQSFFNATPVVQVEPTGASGHTSVGGTNVNSDDHFTGGVGSSIWSIGDLVRALKLLGLIQS